MNTNAINQMIRTIDNYGTLTALDMADVQSVIELVNAANKNVAQHLRHNTNTNRKQFEKQFYSQSHAFAVTDLFDIREGESTLDVVSRTMQSGSQLLIDRVMALDVDAQLPKPVDNRRRMAWADQGDELDMQRVYNGQLETAWRRPMRKAMRAPMPVAINMSANAPSSQGGAAYYWRTVAVMRLADLLTSAGYSVSINTFLLKSVGRTRFMVRVPVKRFGQAINLSDMTLALSPSFFRTYLLVMIVLLWDDGRCPGGLGESGTFDHFDNDEFLACFPDARKTATVTIRGYDMKSKNAVTDWITTSIKSLEIQQTQRVNEPEALEQLPAPIKQTPTRQRRRRRI